MKTSCTAVAHSPRFKELLKLVGDFWTLRIVAVLESSQLGFCAIERALGDSNPATLTVRLKRLEASGLVARIQENTSDVTYRLTPEGVKLLPIVHSLQELAGEESTADAGQV